jgi:hypothetical protein
MAMDLRRACGLAALMCSLGCKSVLGLDSPGHGPSDAAAIDVPDGVIDAIDGPVGGIVCADYKDTNTEMIDGFPVCAYSPKPTALLTTDITTGPTPSPDCDVKTGAPIPGGGTICIVNANTITIPSTATITARGTNILVLIGDDIDISGKLQVDAATNTVACAAPNGTSRSNFGGAGGGGGGFATVGGGGGAGQAGNTVPVAGGAMVTLPAIPRPGCAGGNGGISSAPVAGGGPGGGAVWVIARRSISISGTLSVVGRGGAGGTGFTYTSGCGNGGGGGGSGGYMRIAAADSVTVGGRLSANGGGGGGGGACSGTPGSGGNDGTTNVTNAVGGPGGGTGTTSGGAGGIGGAIEIPQDGYGGNTFGAGGGGGGAAGAIVIVTPGFSRGGGSQISPIPMLVTP